MNRALVVGFVVLAMLTNSAWARRSIMRRVHQRVEATDRYVDIGVVLRVVTYDEAGESLLGGMPRMRVLREHEFGGTLDAKRTPPDITGPSTNPRVWYVSEDQEASLLYRDDKACAQLIRGSEGAGKTRLLAMWHYFQWLAHLGEYREGGQTAPTGARLEMIREGIADCWSPAWYSYWSSDDLFVMADGTRIQLVSTYRQSKAQGSPIQGYNWSWCGRDEMQDQTEVHEDIESRGRSARNGIYPQLATATNKDDSVWRDLRDKLRTSGFWIERTLSIFRSPFIHPMRIDAAEAAMSTREFRRRYGDRKTGEVADLQPERAVYPAWNRDENLIHLPELGWTDVTEARLQHWGPRNFGLAGHDPGSLFDVTLILKAYRPVRPPQWLGTGIDAVLWVVVDEITTEQTTTEQHVDTVTSRIRAEPHRMHLLNRDRTALASDAARLLVRADPYGNNDSKPDRSCYTVWRNAGYQVHPATYNADGDGPGRVPKDAGIEVVNTLFCNAKEHRRLFIARKPDGTPVAPMLVKSIEASERDLYGKAEALRKDVKDLSHWPAALRYALWALERPRLQALLGARA